MWSCVVAFVVGFSPYLMIMISERIFISNNKQLVISIKYLSSIRLRQAIFAKHEYRVRFMPWLYQKEWGANIVLGAEFCVLPISCKLTVYTIPSHKFPDTSWAYLVALYPGTYGTELYYALLLLRYTYIMIMCAVSIVFNTAYFRQLWINNRRIISTSSLDLWSGLSRME